MPKEIAQISIGATMERMAGTFEFSIIIGLSFLIQFNTHLFLALAARAVAASAAITVLLWLAGISAVFIVMVIHNSTS